MEYDGRMIPVAQAQRLVRRNMPVARAERVPLREAAGRVLAETVRAERDLPPFDRATMDGIAVASAAGGRSFRIERVLLAGQPPGRLKDRGAGCVRIMTGAPLPQGCDTIVPAEDVVFRGDSARVRPGVEMRPGQFVHRRGTDAKRGDPMLRADVVLDGARLAAAASAGASRLAVVRRPAIAIVATGDEIVQPGRRIGPSALRASNAFGLAAMLATWGLGRARVFHARDDRDGLLRIMRRALEGCDLLVTTGGVSAGLTDFVPAVLEELGVRKVFHRVSQRPGKPLWFGAAPGRRPVFGLPGNPVSALTCMRRYVLPALMPLKPSRVALDAEVPPSPRLTVFRPVAVAADGEARLVASPCAYSGSGDLACLAVSDGFVELPPRKRPYRRGEVFAYYGWSIA